MDKQATVNQPPADAGQLVALEPATDDDAPPTAPRSSAAGHWSLLLISAAVMTLSVVLQVRGETEVVTPLSDLPLPGVCTFKRATGADCPGCGLTRCFISLAHGDVARAWRFNPAGLLFFVVVAAQIPYRSMQLWRLRRGRREFQFPALAYWLLVAVAIALLAQWLFKLIASLLA